MHHHIDIKKTKESKRGKTITTIFPRQSNYVKKTLIYLHDKTEARKRRKIEMKYTTNLKEEEEEEMFQSIHVDE